MYYARNITTILHEILEDDYQNEGRIDLQASLWCKLPCLKPSSEGLQNNGHVQKMEHASSHVTTANPKYENNCGSYQIVG